MIGEGISYIYIFAYTLADGGGTLWRWVYHCQARIVADLNKPVLRVTATPANLKKLEWVIRQMFKVSSV